MSYTIQTPRLGLRNWTLADLPILAALNADPEVMRYFPSTQTEEETLGFIQRAQKQFEEHRFTYFAADRLDTGALIGFIGLAPQTYESPYTPAVDIGWRLAQEHWGNGFATEGAKACLEYGFKTIGLEEIIAVAMASNLPSIHVMKKIGMERVGEFDHPALEGRPEMGRCVCYKKKEISNIQ